MQDLINGRCGWCGTDELYVKYHDQEWGKLVTDDKKLFEFLVLESAQAGLSWITILRKREGCRKAFCDFDAEQVTLICKQRGLSTIIWWIVFVEKGYNNITLERGDKRKPPEGGLNYFFLYPTGCV